MIFKERLIFFFVILILTFPLSAFSSRKKVKELSDDEIQQKREQALADIAERKTVANTPAATEPKETSKPAPVIEEPAPAPAPVVEPAPVPAPAPEPVKEADNQEDHAHGNNGV